MVTDGSPGALEDGPVLWPLPSVLAGGVFVWPAEPPELEAPELEEPAGPEEASAASVL